MTTVLRPVSRHTGTAKGRSRASSTVWRSRATTAAALQHLDDYTDLIVNLILRVAINHQLINDYPLGCLHKLTDTVVVDLTQVATRSTETKKSTAATPRHLLMTFSLTS